ncbi:GGDEF domain-containing protein [Candidatus Sulfurimonas baltica]|uniref:diguanylate cyclase n=1 Tax=Candidatus Sulfurimonas baltica TaxID=2740404 RepID=A0A7S7LWF2_9BACT|nr:GGDEF domain-containing protein [Candidatus Sulfurimonas baltica]QOY52655.1 GGDEF domain-containing protein [Candidatus Sulfurimonas baltica]
MTAKTKLLIIVALMLLALMTATIINVALNFRSYSLKGAIEKSNLTANIVRDGLTAHMVNGIMPQRQYFLDQISNNDKIKSLWLLRSENVKKQYGSGFVNETIRDDIDKEVLRTGKMVRKIIEHTDQITLRVTIPYNATSTGVQDNCLNCHEVKFGDTLGAISMEFDVSDLRTSGLLTMLKIFAINLIFLTIALFLIRHYVTPYTKLFTNLQAGIKKAYSGDFTHNFTTSIGGDAKNIVDRMNSLFGKMQETFGNIKYNLATFIPQGSVSSGSISSGDPLHEAKTIINELSDIYKFKKTIELDASKEDVYTRLVDIIKLKYHVGHFAFFEINNVTSERCLVFTTEGDESICFNRKNNDSSVCRAFRTNSVTISTEFPNLCQACVNSNIHYVCIPFTINHDISLVVSMTSDNIDEVEKMKTHVSSIKHYLEAAKPVIESQILMEKLRDTSLRDGMTGLYNRRFLEEFIDKLMSQAERNQHTYSVMMIDIDFFKMVNDEYGHDVGDMVIVALSKVLKESIREADLAIRYGGEEFVVMLQNSTAEGTLAVAEKIHSNFSALSFDVNNEKLKKTISIGIAKLPTDGDTIWKCIKFADIALYKAKNTGRNKIVEYQDEMNEMNENDEKFY